MANNQEQIKIRTLKDFIGYTERIDNGIYRGQRKSEWHLIPKLGRNEKGEPLPKNLIDKIKTKEEYLIKEFRLRLPAHRIDFEQRENYFTYWNTLILGEHYGLHTRLLDFTRNPLVACYFAVKDESKGNSVVYCIDIESHLNTNFIPVKNQNEIYNYDPFKYKLLEVNRNDYVYITKDDPPNNMVICPANIDKRVSAQSSVFMYFRVPNTSALVTACKFIPYLKIENKYRVPILKELNNLGVNEETLFPDLGGVCNHLNWEVNNIPNRVFK